MMGDFGSSHDGSSYDGGSYESRYDGDSKLLVMIGVRSLIDIYGVSDDETT